MRFAAVLALLALIVAVPGADAKRKPGKRVAVTKVRAKAPQAWRARPAFSRAPVVAPAATPAATAVPTAAPSATPTATPETTPPPASPRSVSVVSREWSFTLSQTTVDAGDVRVQFDNSRAEDPHQLVLVGGGDVHDAGTAAAGEIKRVTVPLRSGTYQLLCPLPEHETRGMSAKLTVR